MTESDLIIRTPGPADGPAIGRVHVDAWQHAYADIMPAAYLAAMDVEQAGRRWQRILNLPPDGNEYLVAERAGRVIGFTVFGRARDDVPETMGEVGAINFVHDAWGRGDGTALFTRAVERLRELGFTAAYLWVAADNDRAIGFYEHRGWRDDGIEKQSDQGGLAIAERRYSTRF